MLRVLQGLVFLLFILRISSLQAGENWLPDLLTHFLFQYAVAAGLLAAAFAVLRSWRFAAFAMAIALVSLAQLWTATTRVTALASARPVLTVVQFNTLFRNTDHGPLIRWLHANAGAFDIVALHEATPGLGRALVAVEKDYPYRFDETRNDASGTILLSRTPFGHEKIRVQTPLFPTYIMHITLAPPSLAGGLSFYALHAMTPIWGKYQNLRNIELAALADAARRDKSPHVIIEGDWNLTPYSPFYRRLRGETGLVEQRRSLLPLPTFPSWGMPWLTQLPIDHILSDGGLRLVSQDTGPALGSDHLPVIDRFVEADDPVAGDRNAGGQPGK